MRGRGEWWWETGEQQGPGWGWGGGLRVHTLLCSSRVEAGDEGWMRALGGQEPGQGREPEDRDQLLLKWWGERHCAQETPNHDKFSMNGPSGLTPGIPWVVLVGWPGTGILIMLQALVWGPPLCPLLLLCPQGPMPNPGYPVSTWTSPGRGGSVAEEVLGLPRDPQPPSPSMPSIHPYRVLESTTNSRVTCQ